MSRIHPTALVDPGAELDSDVHIGPYAVVAAQVRVGARTRIDAHCVVQGRTTIGCDNHFYPFASIGAQPQDISHDGEITELLIGDRNTVREFCTLNTGTAKEHKRTRIGNDNWIMAYTHIAHDCVVGNHTIFANNATLAGHVHVGDWAVIGGLSGVHQFVHIGAHAMIGFQSHVAQDVPPFMTVEGHPLQVRAVNLVGIKRRDFSDERIAAIRQMHKLLYRDGLTLQAAKVAMAALAQQQPQAAADVQSMLDFLASATRGIVR